MRSLRTRLILSHLLPLLIVIPLVGIALTYLLKTQVLLARLSNELELQAGLVAAVTRDYPEVWYDPEVAQAFMARIAPRLTAKVAFLAPDGTLMASSDEDDAAVVGQKAGVPGLEAVLSSRTSVKVNYGTPGTAAADVLMPVISPLGQVVGIIRLTDPLSSVYERFPQSRSLIAWVLVGGLGLGAILGWVLAVDLARPLRKATDELARMADGQALERLPEQGPDEVRMLVRAFNALSEQLGDQEKSRKRLLANLVHELGRPLGALLSASQALAGGAAQDPELRQELLDGMEAQIQRMRSLLDDLTRLYNQSLGPLELDRRATAMLPWLSQVLSPWRQAAQEAGLQWKTEWATLLPEVQMDADRMAQALGNIVSNAVKYTSAGGEVEISAGVDGAQVWIRVRDTGIGIPPEVLPRIFEAFYRGPVSRRFPQGMGLGLSIARDLVNAHGGHIEVDSTYGKGSLFTIWLPVGGG